MEQTPEKGRTTTHATKACLACKKAKNRCLLPADGSSRCRRCETKDIDCQFGSAPDGRSMRPSAKTDLAQLHARNLDLERRVLELERLNATTTATQSTTEERGTGSNQASPSFSLDSSGGVESADSRDAEAEVQKAAESLGRLRLENDGELRYHTEINSWASLPIEAYDSHPPFPANLGFLPVALSTELHSRIIGLAFQWHLNILRAVDQTGFIADVKTGQRTSLYSPFLHLAVLAIGSRYIHDPPTELCTDPNNSQTRGDPFLNAALDLLVSEIRSPKLSTIRGLLTIGDYLGGAGRMHQGWIYAGIAVRLCDDFGLNLCPPSDQLLNPLAKEYRLATFWAAFSHDCEWSFCIGRHVHFDLDFVFQPDLPLEPFNSVNDGVVWPYFVRLQKIAWRVTTINYSHGVKDAARRSSSAHGIWSALQHWRSELPPALQDVSLCANSPELFQLHLNYAMLVVLLLKPFYRSASDPALHAIANQHCPEAAHNVANLVKRYQQGPGLRFSSINVYHPIFHGAAMSLQIASITTSPENFNDRLADASVCIQALLEHAETWSSSSYCASALTSLHDTLCSGRVSDAAALEANSPSTSLFEVGGASYTLPPWQPFNDGVFRTNLTQQSEPAWDLGENERLMDLGWDDYLSSGWQLGSGPLL